jgi:hypothetical protein
MLAASPYFQGVRKAADDSAAIEAPQRADDDEGPPVSCVPVSGFDGGGGVGVVVIWLTV